MSKFSLNFFLGFTTSFLGQVFLLKKWQKLPWNKRNMVRTAWREKKSGVFQTESVKNEDLGLHDFTANQGVTFLFPNESRSAFSILLLQPCQEKKEFL